MKRIFPVILATALLLAAPFTQAQELGSPAPALSIDQWIKGGPVNVGPGDKVYVVEFWATWCPPCRKSIPHLTELQKKFKDKGVVVVGVSREGADEVRPFVEGKGAEMDYAVATDKDGETSAKYMDAFKQEGIPAAFVVDKQGKIVWVGHPMDGLDFVVEEVVNGTYSVEKTKAREAKREEMRGAAMKINEALQAKDKVKLSAASEEFFAKYPDEGDMLNQVAWILLTHDNKELHNYPLALKIAKAAVEATKWKNYAAVDTYARALFETGDVKGAIETQEKAVAAATDDEDKAELQEALDKYKKAAAEKV